MSRKFLDLGGVVSRRVNSRIPVGLVIEPMRRRHVREIMAIETQVYPKPWSPGVFSREIDQVRAGTRYYVVGRLDGELIGYGGMMFVDGEAHITNIAVDPRQHRKGIGRHLLTHLVETAIERSCSSMTLEVRVGNTAAIEMYRRFGFAPAGVRQRYYENSEDALVMWAHDIDTDEFAERLRREKSDDVWTQ